jgi:hypothetical protein
MGIWGRRNRAFIEALSASFPLMLNYVIKGAQLVILIRRLMPNEISSLEVSRIRVRWITRIRCVVELAGPTDIKRVALTGIKRVALTGIK